MKIEFIEGEEISVVVRISVAGKITEHAVTTKAFRRAKKSNDFVRALNSV